MEHLTLADLAARQSDRKASTMIADRLVYSQDDESQNAEDELQEAVTIVCDNMFADIDDALDKLFDVMKADWVTGQVVAFRLDTIETRRAVAAIDLQKLRTSARLAREAYLDKKAELYQKLVEGTVGDRTAYSESRTFQEKYFALVKEETLASAESRMDSVNRRIKRVESTMWRIIQGEGNE